MNCEFIYLLGGILSESTKNLLSTQKNVGCKKQFLYSLPLRPNHEAQSQITQNHPKTHS